MIPGYIKLTLLVVSCLTLYVSKFVPGTKDLWVGITRNKYVVFLFVLLYITVTFLVGERSGADLIDTNRLLRIIFIFLIIILAWGRTLGMSGASSSVPLAIKFMLAYVGMAAISSVYSLLPTLTLYKSLEVFAHVSFAIMIAKEIKTKQDAQVVLNLIWLGLLFLVIETFWGAILFPAYAFQQNLQFEGITGLFPKLNLNTASQVGATMAVGSIAMIFSYKHAKERIVWLIVACSGVAVLLFAHSRTSLFALVACIVIYSLYVRSKTLKFLVIAGSIVGAIISTVLLTYIYRGQTEAQFMSMTGRVQFWDQVIDKIIDSPIIGYGYYSSSGALFGVPGADNTYLTVMLGGGVILLAVFIAPILIATYQIYLSRPSKSIERKAGFYQSLWMQVAGLYTILFIRSLTGPSFDAHHIALLLYLLTLVVSDYLFRNRNSLLKDAGNSNEEKFNSGSFGLAGTKYPSVRLRQ